MLRSCLRRAVIRITPFAPRLPYAPVEPASFRTSIRPTDPGGINESALAERDIPSTRISGSLFPINERAPRMRREKVPSRRR